MTGTTSPDGIVYPDDYGAPADVPNDMQAMADSVQTALNKRVPVAASKVNISRATGWGNNFPTASKSGKLVVLSSHFQRSAVLTVAANTAYPIGTLPAGYRPAVVERFPVVWSDAGTKRTGGQLQIAGDGEMLWTPTAAASLSIDDWVSVSGCVFVTP